MISVCIALLIGVITTILWHFKYRHLYKHTNNIPGPSGYPIIGNALDFGRNPVDFLQGLYDILENHGPICRFWIGLTKVYIISSDPDFVENLLTSQKYLRKSIDYNFFRGWLGNGLLVSTGSHWHKRRKIITPTFHFKILEEFIPIINNASKTLIEKLSTEIDKDVVDIYPYITLYALDVICETAMGTSVHAQTDPNNEYCTSVRNLSKIVIDRVFSFWKQYDFMYKFSKDYQTEKKLLNIMHGFTKSVIKKRRESLLNQKNEVSKENDDDIGTKKRIAFLDLLLQSTIDGEPLTDEDIAAEVDTFMFEGHDTTASAISFALFSIAKHPEIQKKMLDEVKSIFSDDIDYSPTLQDINQMKYIEFVAKETLRLYPSVPFYGRLLEEDIEFKGKIYPKGAMISIITYHMHRRSSIFKDPEVFNPDRFDAENMGSKHPFSYVPFSAGPRNCIGQKFAMLEIKATLAKIVLNFELSSVDSVYDPILSGELILKSANGISIKLKKRN